MRHKPSVPKVWSARNQPGFSSGCSRTGSISPPAPQQAIFTYSLPLRNGREEAGKPRLYTKYPWVLRARSFQSLRRFTEPIKTAVTDLGRYLLARPHQWGPFCLVPPEAYKHQPSTSSANPHPQNGSAWAQRHTVFLTALCQEHEMPLGSSPKK